jgi:hypothetical protein
MNDIIKDFQHILFCSNCGFSSTGNVYTIQNGNLICQHCYINLKREALK